MRGPTSLRRFSTMTRKMETFLLSLKAPPDKILSIIDNSVYGRGREGEREQHKHVQGETGDRGRQRQTIRLHTTKVNINSFQS